MLLHLGIWGSFYAILLQRVLKEEGKLKAIKDNDNEKQLLGNKRVFSFRINDLILYRYGLYHSALLMSRVQPTRKSRKGWEGSVWDLSIKICQITTHRGRGSLDHNSLVLYVLASGLKMTATFSNTNLIDN